jgi:hypothetical protein
MMTPPVTWSVRAEAPPRSRSGLSFEVEVESEPLGRARRRPSAEAEVESEPWVGRVGVRRLSGPRPSPSPRSGEAEFVIFRAEPESEPWVGRSGASYGARGRTWPLSASLCRVAQQSERRGRRCLLVRLVSGAAK